MAGGGTTEAQHCRPACDKVTKRGGHWRSGQGQGGRFGEGLAPCEGLGLYPVRGSLVSPGQTLASVGGVALETQVPAAPETKGLVLLACGQVLMGPSGSAWTVEKPQPPRDPGGVSPGPTMAGLFPSGPNPFPMLFPAVSL